MALARHLALAALLTALPAVSAARCTQHDLAAFGTSVARALRCGQNRLRTDQATCQPPPGPACAGSAIADALTLLFGDPPAAVRDPGAAATQLRCQRALVKASTGFLTRRLGERQRGERRQTGSLRPLRVVLRRCAVRVAEDAGGVTVPRLGGPCTGALDGAGTAVAQHLLRCLRPALERIANDVAPQPLPPNIVLVLTDDQRWDTLGYMPAVTKLAARGVTFTNAFASSPLCGPSRASILSGQYAHHHGVISNVPPSGGAPAFDASDALPVWLERGGYRTGLFGKYINSNNLMPLAPPSGWGEWQTFREDGGTGALVFHNYTLNENGRLVHYGASPAEYSTDLLRDRVLGFIETNAAVPFFGVYAPFAPHLPAVPALRHAGRFATLAPWRPPSWAEPDLSDKPPWITFTRSVTTAVGLARSDEERVAQLESLLAVDEAVGAITARLERLGLSDNTVVVFTSDNGYMWREHWWFWKLAAYEESVRVPLVVHYPLLAPLARQTDALVLNVDLAPTFAELAGVVAPPTVDGRSLASLVRGVETPWRSDVLLENMVDFIQPPYTAVRSARWKLIRHEPDPGVLVHELYDLAADPYELDNRAADPAYAAVRAFLDARLDALRAE